MGTSLQNRIRTKLQDYRVALNTPDTSLPLELTEKKTVAVIGGGIAGISAAANLAERGFKVTLYEKENYLGGKAGAWTFESKGELLNTEHGFHAFFRQYYNLRSFMRKIGAYDNLIPITDYLIMLRNGSRIGFSGIRNTPGLNILDLRKKGVYSWLTFLNPFSLSLLQLLKYDREKTFKKFDDVSFERFAKRARMPKKMRIVFTTFARAFFSQPDKMSMAELIKGFHFYFLSNEEGLLYDVLNDDFQESFIRYCERFITQHGGVILKNTPVTEFRQHPNGFTANGNEYDYVVLCTDVKQAKSLVDRSASLQQYRKFHQSVNSLKSSDRYAVLRLWTDRFEKDQELPFFIFTDRIECLDSITLYHKMEKTSAEWSRKNNGGIIELHSYALPDHLRSDEKVKGQLLQEFYHYFPEFQGMTIRHAYFQHRQDFPAFHTGLYSQRPEVVTSVPGLYLAGDWVKMDNTTMLMEAAYTSGAMAANEIFRKERLRENLLESVPAKGLLA